MEENTLEDKSENDLVNDGHYAFQDTKRFMAENRTRSEEHTSEPSHSGESRMPSSA